MVEHSSGTRYASRKWRLVSGISLAVLGLLLISSTHVAGQVFPSPMALRGPVRALESDRQTTLVVEYLSSNHQSHSRRLSSSDAEDQAKEVGAKVRKAIKQLRGGTDKFYRELISAVKIYICKMDVDKVDDPENPSIRFVSDSSSLAYKDDDGNCIKLKNPSSTVQAKYNAGKCEVKPNCYWSDFDPDTDSKRLPVYSTTEADQPAEGSMTYDEAETKIKNWAQGLMIFVIPGIILSVLSLLTMIFFLICRCCCNRCGGRSPKEGGYTCMQKFLPLLFFLLFAVGVVAVAGVSLLYQKTLMDAISDTFNASSGTLTNASQWIGDIQSPLISIRDTVETSASMVSTKLTGSSFIEDGISTIIDDLDTFSTNWANKTLPDGCDVDDVVPGCLPCQVCTTISNEVGDAADEMRTNAEPGIEELQNVRTELQKTLVSIASSVRDSIDTQVSTTDDLITVIDDTLSQVDDARDQFDSKKIVQQVGVLVLFGLALIVVAIGFVGILFGLTPLKFLANIIHIAYFIGFIALFLTFIISAVFLAGSVVLGDICEVTNIFTEDWTVALGDSADAVNACFQNESLIIAFNLTSKLAFARGGIDFPDLDLSNMLDFSSLDTFNTAIMNTDASTFAVDSNAITSALAALNAYTVQSDGSCVISEAYTLANIYQPWEDRQESQTNGETGEEYISDRYTTDPTYNSNCPGGTSSGQTLSCYETSTTCTFAIQVTELYHTASYLSLANDEASDFVTEMKTDMTNIMTATTDFTTKTTALANSIDEIKTNLENNLIKYVDEFESYMYCTFLADGYYQIYNALCGNLMPSLTMISLMLFLAGVFLIPVNICLIIACKRLKARGNGGHVMDNEMKFK